MGNKIRFAPPVFITMALAVLLLPLRWIVAWLIAVTVHETGHLLACCICGSKIHSVTIKPMGAVIESDSLTPEKQLLTSLAGPIIGASLILLAKWLPVTAALAACHSLFNLLPIRNLDGSAALENFLYWIGFGNKTDNICRIIDGITRCVLAGFVLYIFWRLSWPIALFALLLVFRGMKRTSCKHSALRVQ